MTTITEDQSLAVLTQPIQPEEIEWKEYGSYLVSSDGQIFSTLRRRLVGSQQSHGYIAFWNNDLQRKMKVHRAVAIVFLPNPDNCTQINHKDGDKANNEVANLEWCDQSHNIQHAYDSGLMRKGYDERLYNSLAICAYYRGQLVGRYISVTECARQLGLTQSLVSLCITGKRKQTKGYTFQTI